MEGTHADLSGGALGGIFGNTRSHRVNLFENQTQKQSYPDAYLHDPEENDEADLKDFGQECDVDSQGDEQASPLMEEYKLFGQSNPTIQKNEQAQDAKEPIPSNQKSSLNGVTQSTGFHSILSPNSNQNSMNKGPAIVRSVDILEKKKKHNQTCGKHRVSQVYRSNDMRNHNLPQPNFMSQDKRQNVPSEDNDLFVPRNSSLQASSRDGKALLSVNKKFDVSKMENEE